CREDLARVIPALASAKQQRDALSIARDCANTLVGARNRARECAKQREQTLSDLDIAEELGRAGREQLEALRSEYAGADGELKDLRYDGELHRALELARDRAKQIEQAAGALQAARTQANDRSKFDAANAALAAAQKELADAEGAVHA